MCFVFAQPWHGVNRDFRLARFFRDSLNCVRLGRFFRVQNIKTAGGKYANQIHARSLVLPLRGKAERERPSAWMERQKILSCVFQRCSRWGTSRATHWDFDDFYKLYTAPRFAKAMMIMTLSKLQSRSLGSNHTTSSFSPRFGIYEKYSAKKCEMRDARHGCDLWMGKHRLEAIVFRVSRIFYAVSGACIHFLSTSLRHPKCINLREDSSVCVVFVSRSE